MMTTNDIHRKPWLGRGVLLVSAIFFCASQGHAQETTDVTRMENPLVITNAQMLGVGATNILDTYLSPEKYNGVELRYISHTTRGRPRNNWSRQIIYSGDLAYTHNRAEVGNEMAGMFYFSYGAHYNWKLLHEKLTIKAGVLFDANVGFIYNTRNGNNPAQAKVYVNITPSVEAEYRFRVKRRDLTIHYEVDAPLAGLMFSPNYGQSYYDIFSNGNYDHNIVPTTFVSTPSLRQMLAIDISVRKTAVRVGYLGDYQQARVNNLRSHTYTHALVIGVVRRFSIEKLFP